MSEDGPKPAKRARYMLRSSQLRLMALNDDCLLEIFGYLKVTKLCIIAQTCKRAQALAQYTFGMKYHRLELSIFSGYLNMKFDLELVEGSSWKRTENFLEVFGNCIQSLTISRHQSWDLKDQSIKNASRKILTLIGRHCCKSLTELKLTNIYIKVELMENAKQVFDSLKTLVLKNCTFGDHLCLSTENLEVLDVEMFSGTESVIKFLDTAKALKRFSIIAHRSLPCSIVNAIGQSIHLEELVIMHSGISAPHSLTWVALKKLKVLKVHSTSQLIKSLLDGFAENDVPIEHLQLMHMYGGKFMVQDFIESIVELKTIKVLKIDVFLTEVQLLDIAKNLKQLTELHIYDAMEQELVKMLREADRLSYLKIRNRNFELSIDTYNKMLKIVQSRPEHIKLTLTLDSYAVKTLDPNATLRSNEKWLSVEEVIRPPR